MNFRFQLDQKLKDAQSISYVFENGKKFHYYPLLFLTAPLPLHPPGVEHLQLHQSEASRSSIKIAFSVPKRRVRKAIHRNRIKRLMREAYRLQQHNYGGSHSTTLRPMGVVAIFIGNEMPGFTAIEKAMHRFLKQL